jgi:hypothetical protein
LTYRQIGLQDHEIPLPRGDDVCAKLCSAGNIIISKVLAKKEKKFTKLATFHNV